MAKQDLSKAQEENMEEEVLQADEIIEESAKKKSKKKSKAKEKVEEKVAALEQEKADYLEALQRERANFENYKKRNAAAVSAAYEDAKLDTAAKFLPVIDNIERALQAAEENSPLKEGILLVEKQLKGILETIGIEEIPAENASFDPNLHNAIRQVPAENGEKSGEIKDVLQKGYQAEGKVVRHSMVTVIE
ncbi:MAG: nucleotide exchange factor GrpE [Christensenellaceae bacterium]|jgi:molecular chaperone GrpE